MLRGNDYFPMEALISSTKHNKLLAEMIEFEPHGNNAEPETIGLAVLSTRPACITIFRFVLVKCRPFGSRFNLREQYIKRESKKENEKAKKKKERSLSVSLAKSHQSHKS